MDDTPTVAEMLILRRVLASEVAKEAVEEIAASQPGVPTGFEDLDRLLGGLRASELIIIAGRPGMGKSSLAANIALHAAKEGRHVGVFSLEAPAGRFVRRLLAAETGIAIHSLLAGELGAEDVRKLEEAAEALTHVCLLIDDTPNLSLSVLRTRAHNLGERVHGFDLLIVDYLQLLHGDGRFGSRVEELAHISRELKVLARELDVPLVAVSQLPRATERRNRRPQLSNLPQGGALEEHADAVIFLHREDAYYTEAEWYDMFGGQGKPYPRNIAEIIVAKHRQGPTGMVNLYFHKELCRLDNLAKRPWPEEA